MTIAPQSPVRGAGLCAPTTHDLATSSTQVAKSSQARGARRLVPSIAPNEPVNLTEGARHA